MQNTVKLIFLKCGFTGLQITVFILSQNRVLLFLQTITVFFCLKTQFCKVQFSHFGKYSSSCFPKRQFYLFHKLQFFFMSQNIVRIPVEDWHLIYTNFHEVRELLSNALVVFAFTESMPCTHIRHLKLYASRKYITYLSPDGMNE